MIYRAIGECRACFGVNLSPFVDLGWQPPSNDFVECGHLQYPLKVMVCEDCGLGQLADVVDPGEIFNNSYAYYSSQSPSWLEDRRVLADRMINEFRLDAASLVVDVGSNDGYYLRHYVERGIGVRGFEPAENVAEAARRIGVPTDTKFWSRSVHALGADLVNATNVLAHTPDMDSFIEGVAASLLRDGVATLEFPLFSNLIKFNQLDTIYHEHYSYISIRALRVVLSRHGLRIWRIEELATHGGSVRVFACKETARYLEESSVERVAGAELFAPEHNFEDAARQLKITALRQLAEIGKESYVIGYGAPAKATVLSNYLGLDRSLIEFTVDDSPYKQGKRIPGTNIPIVSFECLGEGAEVPDYIVLFVWNLIEPIKKKLQQHYAGVVLPPKLVTLVPKFTVTEI